MDKMKVYCDKCKYVSLHVFPPDFEFQCFHPFNMVDTPISKKQDCGELAKTINRNNDCSYFHNKKWYQFWC